MIHEYKCSVCLEVKEIDKPLSEQYIPICHGLPMKRVYGSFTIKAGKLDKGNLPK